MVFKHATGDNFHTCTAQKKDEKNAERRYLDLLLGLFGKLSHSDDRWVRL